MGETVEKECDDCGKLIETDKPDDDPPDGFHYDVTHIKCEQCRDEGEIKEVWKPKRNKLLFRI